MKILIGFEHTQRVCEAFRKKGHEAYSNDYLPGDIKKSWHLQGDFFDFVIKEYWDMVIIHPPCTYTALCGNRWYHNTAHRLQGIELCKNAWEIAKIQGKKACLEQPKTIMQNYIGKKTQVIHPWQFGHGETKETWLWLHNVEPLKPTNIVEGRENKIWKMPPGPNRQKERSKTYQGIANAMAEQWG